MMQAGEMMSQRVYCKLQQVKSDIGILEVDEGFEDVASNVFPNFELEAAELVTGTAARL